MRRIGLLLIVSLLVLGACGAEDDGDESRGAGDEPTTSQSSTTETAVETSSTVSETTTSTELPGEPIDLYAVEGAELGVIGVERSDVLYLRTGPGSDYEVLVELAPTATGLIATGENRSLTDSIWYQVEAEGKTGWVNARYTAYIGGTQDITDELDEPVEAASPEAAAEAVAVSRAGDVPESDVVIVDGPNEGDEVEIIVDVVGFGDDAVTGERLRIHLEAASGGDRFTVSSVESTVLCTRGISDDGLCL